MELNVPCVLAKASAMVLAPLFSLTLPALVSVWA